MLRQRARSSSYRLPQPTRYLRDRKTTTWIWGYVLLVSTFVLFFISMYALVVSKIMPPTGVPLLDAMKYDWYYCTLVPGTILFVGFLHVYLNWMGMKFFRHN